MKFQYIDFQELLKCWALYKSIADTEKQHLNYRSGQLTYERRRQEIKKNKKEHGKIVHMVLFKCCAKTAQRKPDSTQDGQHPGWNPKRTKKNNCTWDFFCISRS
jgi:hypothetical protein